jgi:hypothetical protein
MTQEIIYKDFFIRPITEQQALHNMLITISNII